MFVLTPARASRCILYASSAYQRHYFAVRCGCCCCCCCNCVQHHRRRLFHHPLIRPLPSLASSAREAYAGVAFRGDVGSYTTVHPPGLAKPTACGNQSTINCTGRKLKTGIVGGGSARKTERQTRCLAQSKFGDGGDDWRPAIPQVLRSFGREQSRRV